MKIHSGVMGLILAMVCCSYSTESTFGQADITSNQSSSTSNKNSSGKVSEFQKKFFTGNTSVNRSVSFKKDGKRVSITENANGITVSIDGKSVKASNAAELQRKSPEAYILYKERIGAATAEATIKGSGDASSSAKNQSDSQSNSRQGSFSGGGATGGGGASGSVNGQSDSIKSLKSNLNQLRNENANNPQLRRLLDNMLQNVGN
tara:strand:+ start:63 stop:677 length:615 start_codon:yes stop_codon:yes gene_type:complete